MTAAAPPVPVQNATRLADMVRMANGLNAARVFASILVVIFHSAIPYMVSPIPIWIVHDTSQHVSIDMFVFWVNGFVMPLFFLLAGLSIAKSSWQLPFRQFVWQRFCRLGATILLAVVLIMPLLLFSWAIGLLWTERLTIPNLVRLRFPRELHAYLGPGHLWFLEYLLLMSVLWSAVARVALRWRFTARLVQGEWAHGALGSIAGPLVFALSTAVILAFDVDTPFRLIAPFMPDFARVLYYLTFFVAGIWLAGMSQSLATLRAHAIVHLVVATVVFGGLCPLTLSYFAKSLQVPGQWALTGLQAIFVWCMVFGFLGAMLRWCSDRYEWIRYVNEASFWLYLAHFPVVCAMQLVVWPLQINPWGKVMIVAATGIAVSLIVYEYCVRYSWLGAVINGTRKQHVTTRGWRLEAGWLGLASVALILFTGFLCTGWNSFAGTNLHTVVAGNIYRSNRLKPNELNEIIAQHKIRSVISLADGNTNDGWFQSQQEICTDRGIQLATMAFKESEVPTSADLEQLQLALKESLRPVLIIGGNRSPTLSGFGSAVAILVEGGSLDVALGQLELRFFQLEGAEHCIVAQPLREYRTWLGKNTREHSGDTFYQWTKHVQATEAEMTAAKEQQPVWQARMGAPRYPRRF